MGTYFKSLSRDACDLIARRKSLGNVNRDLTILLVIRPLFTLIIDIFPSH